jgi:hypothetical protein
MIAIFIYDLPTNFATQGCELNECLFFGLSACLVAGKNFHGKISFDSSALVRVVLRPQYGQYLSVLVSVFLPQVLQSFNLLALAAAIRTNARARRLFSVGGIGFAPCSQPYHSRLSMLR